MNEKTVTELAIELSVPSHRVVYAIRERKIKPSRMAGNIRLFDAASAQLIRQAVRDAAKARRLTASKS